MDDFLNLPLRKQKRHLKQMDDCLVVDLLKNHYIPSVELLGLVVERLQELRGDNILNAIGFPIRKAIEHGNMQHIQMLLPFHQYNPHSDLLLCLKHNQFAIFDVLLAHTHMDKHQVLNKVLADIVLMNNRSGLEHVVSRGADVSWGNLSALRGAIEAKSLKIADMLIELSDMVHCGSSALSLAARKNHPTLVEKMLKAGAPYDKDNCVALKAAIIHNNLKVIDVFLQHGPIYLEVMMDAFCTPSVQTATIEKLWNHCNIEQLRTQSYSYTEEGLERFEQMYSQHQKQLLMHNVGVEVTVERTRKI